MRGTCGTSFSQVPLVLGSPNLVHSFLMTFPPGVFRFVSNFLFSIEVSSFEIWSGPVKFSDADAVRCTCGTRFSQLPFVLDLPNLVHGCLMTFPPGVFRFVSRFLFSIEFSTFEIFSGLVQFSDAAAMRGTCGSRFSRLPFVLDLPNLVYSRLMTFPPGVFRFVSKFLFFSEFSTFEICSGLVQFSDAPAMRGTCGTRFTQLPFVLDSPSLVHSFLIPSPQGYFYLFRNYYFLSRFRLLKSSLDL